MRIFWKDYFDSALALFLLYGYGANASEAVEKIAADKKDYHKFLLCIIVCIVTTNQ